MLEIPNKTLFVDVDSTLIRYMDDEFDKSKVIPNNQLISKLQQYKDKGYFLMVWTSNSGGIEHAKWAIELCGISDLIDAVSPKPATIIDDDHLEYYTIIDPWTFESRFRIK